jgi:hypothetical protein
MAQTHTKTEKNNKTGRTLLPILAVLAVAALWLGCPAPVQATQTATMAWNASSDPSVAGYYIYAQADNSTNLTRIDVGRSMKATLDGLKEGITYTFTVKAYNSSGVESAASNAAKVVVPVPLQLLDPTSNGSQRLQYPVAQGHWYEIQASTDLMNWTTISQTGVASAYAWTVYQDLQSTMFPARYYRLRVH